MNCFPFTNNLTNIVFQILSVHQKVFYKHAIFLSTPKGFLFFCHHHHHHTHLIHKHRRKAQKHNRLNSVFISRLRKYCFRHFSFGTISFFTGLKKTTRFSLLCVHDLRDYITFDSIMFSHHRPLRNNFINAFWTI